MSDQFLKDKFFMSKALEEAKLAFEKGEIPVWEMLVPPYILFYFENKVLAVFEVMLNIIALVLYFFSVKKAN